MKNIFVSLLTLLSIWAFSHTSSGESVNKDPLQDNPNSWSEETDIIKPTFKFDRVVLTKLEKDLKYSDYYRDSDKILYSGARIVKDKSMKVSDGTYIKLSSIPETEKFVFVSSGANDFYLIRNVRTKELYVLHSFTLYYEDFSSSSTIHKKLVKTNPIPLSAEEQIILNQFKSLIKDAYANINILLAIQKKCLTRGYFDESKITVIDKKTFNKNLNALKLKADKLSDLRKYEDKDKKAQDKLTLTELSQISTIIDWSRKEIIE